MNNIKYFSLAIEGKCSNPCSSEDCGNEAVVECDGCWLCMSCAPQEAWDDDD